MNLSEYGIDMSKRINILSVYIPDESANTMKMASEIFVASSEELPLEVPIQIVLEVIPRAGIAYTVNDPEYPSAPGQFAYVAEFKSAKGRVKPGTPAFNDAEEKALDALVTGHDKVQKFAEEEIIEESCNRFTGIDIDDS